MLVRAHGPVEPRVVGLDDEQARAALVAVACQDTPTEPVEQPVATAPEFNFMNGPEIAGVVTRGEYEGYTIDMFWETPADPWILWMGLKPGDVPSWCGGGEVPEDLRAYQEIGAKHGETVIYNEILKNAPVTVFEECIRKGMRN